MSPASILEIIGFHKECPYQNFKEFLADALELFDDSQKLKIRCMQNLAKELIKEQKEVVL